MVGFGNILTINTRSYILIWFCHLALCMLQCYMLHIFYVVSLIYFCCRPLCAFVIKYIIQYDTVTIYSQNWRRAYKQSIINFAQAWYGSSNVFHLQEYFILILHSELPIFHRYIQIISMAKLWHFCGCWLTAVHT